MEFNDNLPIYQQIVDLFKAKLISGELKQGDKVDSVRELAIFYGVNPNTMQKALSFLEMEGLVYSERTSGRFVTNNTKIMEELKNKMLNQEIERFLTNMKAMGYDYEDILKVLKQCMENNNLK